MLKQFLRSLKTKYKTAQHASRMPGPDAEREPNQSRHAEPFNALSRGWRIQTCVLLPILGALATRYDPK